jgi:hypothetical protein
MGAGVRRSRISSKRREFTFASGRVPRHSLQKRKPAHPL